MFLLGVTAVVFAGYGIYLMCCPENEIKNRKRSRRNRSREQSDGSNKRQRLRRQVAESKEVENQLVENQLVENQLVENQLVENPEVKMDTSESEDMSMDIDIPRPEPNDADQLWDSCQLEYKYHELEEKIPHLHQPRWKKRIQERLREIYQDPDYQKDYERFIKANRNSRNPDCYAVVEDTALNLLEHYELSRSNLN